MDQISIVGIDLAKSVMQVHGVDAAGAVVVQRRLRRGQVMGFFARLPRCVIGLEACATAHYWGRELKALGHEVRLIPPAYVKAYVRRNKNDAADGGDLRGGEPAIDAVCGAEDGGATGGGRPSQGARAAGQTAHHDHQYAAWPDGRVWHRCSASAAPCRSASGAARRPRWAR